MSQSSPDATNTALPEPVSTPIRLASMLGGAIAGTALSYLAIGFIGEVYPTPPELLNLGAAPTPEEYAAANAAVLVTKTGNAVVWMATVGAIICGLLALTSGLLRRSGIRILLSVICGIVLGGILGGVAGRTAAQMHTSISAEMIGDAANAETKFMMMHGLTWLLVGLAAGLACEIGNRNINLKSATVALLVGGIMGGVAGFGFPLLVAVAAPLLDSSLPIPAIGTGLAVFVGFGALMISIGVDQATTSK